MRGLAILVSLLISFAAVSAQVEEGEVSVRTPTDTEHFSMRKFIIFVLALFFVPELVGETRAFLGSLSNVSVLRSELPAYVKNVKSILDECYGLSFMFIISSLMAYISTYFSFVSDIADMILPIMSNMTFFDVPWPETPWAFLSWALSALRDLKPLFQV